MIPILWGWVLVPRHPLLFSVGVYIQREIGAVLGSDEGGLGDAQENCSLAEKTGLLCELQTLHVPCTFGIGGSLLWSLFTE